jgi:hypothetical protein
MTDRPHLLAGLLARRHEVVQEISAMEAKLRQNYETLQSLDYLIRVEDEDVELSPVPYSATVKRRRSASTLMYGDVGHLCLDALREAGGQVLTTGEVIQYIVRKRELVFSTRTQQKDFGSSVAMALARHSRRGLIQKVGVTKNRQGRWSIPSS